MKSLRRKKGLGSPWWWGYAVAVVGTLIAAFARWALERVAADLPPYITFYPVVFVAAIVGGSGPGLVATALCILSGNMLFMEPVGKVGPVYTSQAFETGLFLIINIPICILAGWLRRKTEALRESEARLKMAHRAARIGSFEWNLQTGVNVWSPELEAMYGLESGEFPRAGSAWEKLIHPEDRAEAVTTVERALQTFKPEEGEWRIVWPDGTIHWLMARVQAFKDYHGKPERLLGVNIDITGQKEVEKSQRRSADRFRALVRASSYVVYRMSPDWSEMRELSGQDFDTERLSRSWLQKYVDPQDQPQVMAVINEAIRTKSVLELEHRVRRGDGTLGWALWRAVPLLDADGKIIEWLGTASDVTKRKEAEEAVRQSETRLWHFIDSAPVAIAMFDTEMRYLAVSQRWLAAFHLSPEQTIGRSHYELFPDSPERWKEIHRRCLAGAVERAEEDNFERADGSRQWLRWEIHPWHVTAGVVGGIVIFSEDITGRKNAAEALRQSEERFRSMANAIPQLAWIARPDGYVFWFNQRYLDYAGGAQKDLEGWAWQGLHDPQVLPTVLEKWRECLSTGEPFNMEFPLRGADGRFRTFLTRVMPLKDDKGRVTLWFGTHTDISERKQAEAEIITLRDRLAADLAGMNRLQALSTRFVREGGLQILLDAVLDAAIALTGADKGHIQLFDPASGKLGVTAQRGFDPAFVEYSRRIRPGALASGVALQTHQRAIVEDVTTSPLYAEDPRALELVVQSGMRAVVCTPLLTRTDQLLGTLSILFAIPHRPAERDLRLLDLLARQAADSIARTGAEESLRAARQELAATNADLEQKIEARTEKLRETLAELEHMSYSMVHDMRAPLRAMNGFAELLQSECGECQHAPASDYLARIRASADRLDRLITDALNYNELVREKSPIGAVDLGGLLHGMVASYPNLQPPTAEITLDFAELTVLGNQALLTQCFSNLLDNAIKFVAPGVKPRIRIWAEPSMIDGQPVAAIYIKDNGIGIGKDAQERIFSMFQRVHGEGEYSGTGIGLTIVRKAVERMNGQVSVDSDLGKGARFCVKLPRVENSPAL